IAVIRADRSAFTVIHAASLTIERTASISHPESGLRRLLTWLSVLPRNAGAKMGTADVISAQFSPDATRLYIWGFHNEPDPERSREVSTGIGLIAVDVATGEILAEGPAGQLIQRLVASTAGDSLYVTGPSSGAALYSWIDDADVAVFASPHFLQRLDSDTLAVEAETEFAGPIWLAAPAGINGT
ncbi:MAG: hypothetical protein IT336_06675, partial [Thermomicrobiales bacterium]|nr:hypothetical protein [Thermomicrobiales bacterium]